MGQRSDLLNDRHPEGLYAAALDGEFIRPDAIFAMKIRHTELNGAHLDP
jgi:hypothetical protein